MMSLPATVLVLISGNNFRPAGDLWRRLLTCRIDAKTEAPERRSFELEPFEHCRDNRQKMVAAALTLLCGFVANGSPRATPDRLASYEQWDDRVRQAVVWLGMQDILPAPIGDPVDVIARAKRAEPERMKLAALLASAHALMGDSRWLISDLAKLSKGNSWGGITTETDQTQALKAALMEIAGERGDINPRMLGRWIERQAGRRCEGLWFEVAGVRWKTNLWRIRGAPAPDAEAELP
jgi:hypothetical protein